MRTVTGLIEATEISTGIPATRIGAGLAADDDRAEGRRRPGGGEMFQRAAAGEAFGHRDILVQAELLRLTSGSDHGSVTGLTRD